MDAGNKTDVKQVEGVGEAAGSAPRQPPKKSAKDFRFGKLIGEGSFSMVNRHIFKMLIFSR